MNSGIEAISYDCYGALAIVAGGIREAVGLGGSFVRLRTGSAEDAEVFVKPTLAPNEILVNRNRALTTHKSEIAAKQDKTKLLALVKHFKEKYPESSAEYDE